MPDGPAGFNKVVIGAWSADDKTFKPALTVADNGNVTIHGNLTVKGAIIEPLKRTGSQLSPEAQRFIEAGLLSGVTGANLQLERFYRRIGILGSGSSLADD